MPSKPWPKSFESETLLGAEADAFQAARVASHFVYLFRAEPTLLAPVRGWVPVRTPWHPGKGCFRRIAGPPSHQGLAGSSDTRAL